MNNVNLENANLLEVASGAIGERLAYELAKVVDNISDPNTKPDAVRKLQLTISFKPDAERKSIQMSTQVKPTLVPTNNIETALYLTKDRGNAALVEMVPQVPGQLAIDGTEQARPKVIQIVKTA